MDRLQRLLSPLANVSIRGIVRPDDQALIAGFHIAGPGNPKTIIIRGLGPSLQGAEYASDLTFQQFYEPPTLLATNQGWHNLSSTDKALLGGLALASSGDSAVVYGNFVPGSYSAVLSGGTGLGLIELYDQTLQFANPALNSRLTNFSGRGYVQPGDGSLIMGLVVNGTRTAVVRGTSLSSLAPAGLSPVLSDPFLGLNSTSTPPASNDNWQTDPNSAQISLYGFAPGNYLESALLPTLAPGASTVLLSGNPSAPSGYALLEYFDVSLIPGRVVSRKTHGDAGIYDIDLPLIGNPGIECRSGGASNDHQVVFTFPMPVSFTHAAVTSGTGSVSSSIGNGTNTITVNLTGVSDAQTTAVTLLSVTDGSSTTDVSAPLAVLLGDSNGDRLVNSGDAFQTRNRSGQTLDSTNFRSDYTADGYINSADYLLVRARSGNSLP